MTKQNGTLLLNIMGIGTYKMDLFKILEMLKTAPDGQIDEHWLKKCKEFDGSEMELMTLFEDIYNTSDMETSKFVRSMVDPKYTRTYLSS